MTRKKRVPKFRRQEWFRFVRLGEKWRRPRGKDSKMRLGIRGKPAVVSIGYRSPRSVRGTHPSGLVEILVHGLRDLEGLDAGKQAIRIASGVGGRKREQILARAKELGIRVLNPGGEKRGAEHTAQTGG
ncbi:MAG: 50S ribosomal protein L32e [Candidatus Hadarchaeaceae archaeon]